MLNSHKISSHGSLLNKKYSTNLVLVLDDVWFVSSSNIMGQNRRCGVTEVHMQLVKFP
jgi:hypothetical protein